MKQRTEFTPGMIRDLVEFSDAIVGLDLEDEWWANVELRAENLGLSLVATLDSGEVTIAVEVED